MDDETRNYFGKIISARCEAIRTELELLDEIYNELGKPIMTEPTKEEKEESLFSHKLIKGIKWSETVARSGRPSITAMPEENVNNPNYESLRKRITDMRAKGENAFPFWISAGKLCRDRPKKKI